MSHPDRSPRSIPARASDLVPAQAPPPVPPVVDGPPALEPSGPRARGLSAGLAWRAFRRHWWQALLLWAAGSSALMALAYREIKPSYDASSTIKVEPGGRGISPEGGRPVEDFEVFKETQARRVANPNVIAAALAAHPDLLGLPGLARSPDAEAEVRKSLGAIVLPGTNLIQVSMSSESAGEAASIVNAVIEAYLKVALDSGEEDTERRCRGLREVKEERAVAVRRKRDAVAMLVERVGAVDGGRARDRNSVTIEQYGVLTRQHLQADLELVEAQAGLDQLGGGPGGPPAVATDPDAEVVAAFYATPQVAEVRARLDKAREGLALSDRVARNASDPSLTASRRNVEEIQKQLDALWARMRPALARAGQERAARAAERHAAEARVAALKARLAQLGDRLEKLNAQSKAAGAGELTLEFARQDLVRAEAVLDTVSRGLDQAELGAKDPAARFRQEFRAKASNSSYVNHRPGVMAAVPVGMFLCVLGLFAMVERHAGRVHDPDELPGRLKLQVLGVVPPLPRARTAPGRPSTRDEARSRRDLDQFIQSLDHLRVAICSGRDARGRPRRSVLITSACGSEGKTTLAAQLAERCVNAGLLTLLVDADLRNPTLSRMFEMPGGRGLVDVLRGESTAEEAIAVIGGAGGFHFLPAGSPRVDPSRLLHGDRLARLLASARESFDLVIVDAPPVLPVPDALTIGRWVDGAVLAVRFDNSRYPLVERANRRLAAVGVPVIGAVLNGVRGAEAAYYGSYHPSHGTPDAPEAGPSYEPRPSGPPGRRFDA